MAINPFKRTSSSERTVSAGIATGFLKSDIAKFLSQGASLAKKGGGDITAPKLASREIFKTQKIERESGLFKDETKVVSELGGERPSEFSSVTSDQLTNLVNIFSARKNNILSRRLQPGRKQLILSR